MGVYIELYTPIFNYNSMSQVIKKFEPGGKTTQPRLYKRGNDDIDLDAYIRDAESEFSYWLANSRLKDKEKQQVQEAYSQMLQGINDGTFTYKIGGGYNNSVGMSNKTKGFDAAGLAAGFLGNVLRNQSVYTPPEEKPDPSKIEWKGNSSIGVALVRRLYGSDKESLKDFIDLDSYDPNTNVKRSARFKSGLEYIRDNFDSLFTSFTDSDKAAALEGINSALSAFNNGTVEDNEYLDLGRATGMSNLRDMFFTGETYGSTTQTPGTAPQGTRGNDGGGGVHTNEDDWRAAKYPRLNTKLARALSLKDPTIYGQWSRQALHNHLSKLDTQTLFDLINYGLSKNVQLYQNPKIVSYAGIGNNPVPFTNKYIINNILKILKDTRNLSQYADISGNQFYIKDSYDKKRGTGLVWDMFNNTINEMSIYDIPWFVTKMHNEFTSQVQSNKNGGRLRRFQTGGWFEKLYKQQSLKNWNDALPNSSWNSNTIFHGHANDLSSVAAANQAYTNDTKAVGQDINDFVKTFDENLTPEQIVALYNENAQKIRSFWDQEVDYNTTNAQEHNRLFSKMFRSRSNTQGGNKAYNLSYQKNLESKAGSQTWHRRMDRYEKEFNQLTPEERKNRIFTITRIVHGKPQVFEVYKKSNGDIALYNDLVDIQDQIKQDIQEELKTNPQLGLTPDEIEQHKPKPSNGSFVGEAQLPAPGLDSPKFDYKELIPDLIGAGRLWASLHTNNRVYDTVLPSLKPVLKDTYERYSPVTGAFSARQFKNRQAADVMRQSSQAFTSDASLAAARMLEGQRQANQLEAEGFLADDQEIRRTQAEALARQEDNMARRSEVANFNRASINQTNRERAQLEATRLKFNQQSWDNFLQGVESRIRTRMDENRERANNFYDKLSVNQAEEWYNKVTEPARASLLAWSKTPEGKNADYTEWSEWDKYNKFMQEARARANAMIYSDMSNHYGLHYTNPYTDESNALFNWNRRYV